MEQKLREFKSRRRKEYLLNSPKMFLQNLLDKNPFKKSISTEETEEVLLVHDKYSSSSEIVNKDAKSISSNSSLDLEVPISPWLSRSLYFLYFLFWLIVYLIAIELEFGFVYIVISLLGFIYFNTRTGPKKEGEISAYSVFNPNCESIQGTLKAEDLEKNLNFIIH